MGDEEVIDIHLMILTDTGFLFSLYPFVGT